MSLIRCVRCNELIEENVEKKRYVMVYNDETKTPVVWRVCEKCKDKIDKIIKKFMGV